MISKRAYKIIYLIHSVDIKNIWKKKQIIMAFSKLLDGNKLWYQMHSQNRLYSVALNCTNKPIA